MFKNTHERGTTIPDSVTPGKSWLEVSLVVPVELAEPVAEVLARYLPDGVVIESTRVGPEPEGPGVAEGPLRVFGYIEKSPGGQSTRAEIEKALWYLGRIEPIPEPTFRTIEEQDWSQAWKANFHPIAVSPRLLIQPSWIPVRDEDRVPILIDPGMAFGTGTHPTTQLCLKILDALPIGNNPIIDVGCGSAVLSIAAVKLGASYALGVDRDPVAIRVASRNVELNQVTNSIELGIGSVGEIVAGNYSISKAPLVVANIIAPVLLKLFFQGLSELMTPKGQLVLSGLLEDQVSEVVEAAQARGLSVRHRQTQGDWVALVMQAA